MFITFFLILSLLPNDMTLSNAMHIAGANEKMNVVDFSFDPETRYTLWSGLAGGFFLSLAYFGTDQSQVGRYLSGKSDKESQMGLIMNGFLKVPMQFFILLIGVLVFVFFQFNDVPLNFNPVNKTIIEKSTYAEDYHKLEDQLKALTEEKKEFNLLYIDHLNQNYDNPILRNRLTALSGKESDLRDQAKVLIEKADPKAETNDKDYVFLYFILNYLPKGLIGLLLAVILSAAMSSSASGLNALASTTAIDIYKRNIKEVKSDKHYVMATRYFTLLWGFIAIMFACVGTLFENLIQLVNIVGSIFYGTVLGIFLVGFYIKFIKATAIFYGAVISQLFIFFIYYLDVVSFLWLNFIGALLTIVFAGLIQISFLKSTPFSEDTTIID